MESPIEKDFLESYKAHTDALFRYCYAKTGDRELAKDLTQDVFIKTWQYLLQGGKIISFKPFLYRTAHNLVIDEYRKKKITSLDSLRDEGFDPGDASEEAIKIQSKGDGEYAIRLIQTLPETYREAVFMQYVDGLSIKEIAEILEESENNISVRIHRGIQKLKEMIEHE